jgi:hypothetical protein
MNLRDQCAHKKFFHRDVLEPSAGHGTAKLRRHKEDVAATTGPFQGS